MDSLKNLLSLRQVPHPIAGFVSSDIRLVKENKKGEIEELQLVDYEQHEIEILIANIGKLASLKMLSLKGGPIIDFYFIANLPCLETLYVVNSKIINPLHPIISSSLIDVYIDNCSIDSMGIVANMPNLLKLQMIHNNITELILPLNPEKLLTLNLSANQISDIKSIEKCINLEVLWLYGNRIREISSIKKLNKIKALGLGGNEIEDFSLIQGLKNISRIQISNGNLNNIELFSEFKKLEKIQVAKNKISDLQPLVNLDKLKYLDIADNLIEEIPKWIIKQGIMPVLEYDYKQSRQIIIKNNPLSNPPIEIVAQGVDALKLWFVSEKVFINEVKVLLVGHGEVGKTSLVKALTKKRVKKTEKATHHINISSHEVRYKRKKVKLNFWDFGGQEIMHSTHQFFLSNRSVYLLVLDGRRDEDAEYWLKYIESFGGNSPVIIVMNKIDTNPSYDVDRLFLQKKYPFIRAFCKTQCLGKKDGIKELTSEILKVLGEVELLNTAWPKHWLLIKKKLEQTKDDIISQKEYESICKSAKLSGKIERNSLATYLHDLGVIVHFKDLRLSDLHILQPRWASRAAYKIINSKKVADNKGLLRVEWLKTIMKKSDASDFEYEERTFPFILDLMQKFELCFPISDCKEYLIPELLENRQPILPEHHGPVLNFVFQYDDLMPRSVLMRFIVRMHSDIQDKLLWRTGVVLSIDMLETMAIIIADIKEKRIHISVSGNRRRDHFAIIRSVFHNLHKTFEKLSVRELIPLPEHPLTYIEYDELIGYESSNKPTYFNGKLKKEFNVTDLLNGIELQSVRRNEFIWDVFICHSSKDKLQLNEFISELKSLGIKYWIDMEQILPGDSPIDKINDGLLKSKCILACLSKNQLNSGWSRAEYQSILARQLSGDSKRKVIPFILDNLEDEEIPLLLSTLRAERFNIPEQYGRTLEYLTSLNNKM